MVCLGYSGGMLAATHFHLNQISYELRESSGAPFCSVRIVFPQYLLCRAKTKRERSDQNIIEIFASERYIQWIEISVVQRWPAADTLTSTGRSWSFFCIETFTAGKMMVGTFEMTTFILYARAEWKANWTKDTQNSIIAQYSVRGVKESMRRTTQLMERMRNEANATEKVKNFYYLSMCCGVHASIGA